MGENVRIEEQTFDDFFPWKSHAISFEEIHNNTTMRRQKKHINTNRKNILLHFHDLQKFTN